MGLKWSGYLVILWSDSNQPSRTEGGVLFHYGHNDRSESASSH